MRQSRFYRREKITVYFLQLIRIFLKLLHDQGNVVHALQIGAAVGKGCAGTCGNFLCQGGYIFDALDDLAVGIRYRIHTLLQPDMPEVMLAVFFSMRSKYPQRK